VSGEVLAWGGVCRRKRRGREGLWRPGEAVYCGVQGGAGARSGASVRGGHDAFPCVSFSP
jgi:hypothetical protein